MIVLTTLDPWVMLGNSVTIIRIMDDDGSCTIIIILVNYIKIAVIMRFNKFVHARAKISNFVSNL